MFCACEVIQLFSVVLCVVRSVNKFDFRIVTNETHNKQRRVSVKKKPRHLVAETYVFDMMYMFPPTVVVSV